MTYRLLKIEDIEEGMRVRFVIGKQGYNIDERNPGIGTKWECVGTVVQVYSDEVEVEWDNGSMNLYVSGDLTPAQKNYAEGNCGSIW